MLNYHIGRYVLGSLYVGDLVWVGWSGQPRGLVVRVSDY